MTKIAVVALLLVMSLGCGEHLTANEKCLDLTDKVCDIFVECSSMDEEFCIAHYDEFCSDINSIGTQYIECSNSLNDIECSDGWPPQECRENVFILNN